MTNENNNHSKIGSKWQTCELALSKSSSGVKFVGVKFESLVLEWFCTERSRVMCMGGASLRFQAGYMVTCISDNLCVFRQWSNRKMFKHVLEPLVIYRQKPNVKSRCKRGHMPSLPPGPNTVLNGLALQSHYEHLLYTHYKETKISTDLNPTNVREGKTHWYNHNCV